MFICLLITSKWVWTWNQHCLGPEFFNIIQPSDCFLPSFISAISKHLYFKLFVRLFYEILSGMNFCSDDFWASFLCHICIFLCIFCPYSSFIFALRFHCCLTWAFLGPRVRSTEEISFLVSGLRVFSPQTCSFLYSLIVSGWVMGRRGMVVRTPHPFFSVPQPLSLNPISPHFIPPQSTPLCVILGCEHVPDLSLLTHGV